MQDFVSVEHTDVAIIISVNSASAHSVCTSRFKKHW